jgi:Arc/MetJ-type ribon-helix-helix transcriptional regulator
LLITGKLAVFYFQKGDEMQKPDQDNAQEASDVMRDMLPTPESERMGKNHATRHMLDLALAELKENKPNDRSDVDRYWAIVITDVEKAIAVFETYVQ